MSLAQDSKPHDMKDTMKKQTPLMVPTMTINLRAHDGDTFLVRDIIWPLMMGPTAKAIVSSRPVMNIAESMVNPFCKYVYILTAAIT